MLGNIIYTSPELFLDLDNVNPYSGKIRIKFKVPDSFNVSIKIYDLTGDEVMNVLNEFKKTGSYVYTADISRLCAGVYNCVIKADSSKYVKEFLVL